MRSISLFCILLVIMFSFGIQSGCARIQTPEQAPGTTIDLSGEWEYQEQALVQRISLDRSGNGRYAWQDGQFSTTSLSGTRWEGTWTQAGNDREGAFQLELSADGIEAEGTWWYTRIGNQTFAPHERGGKFSLKRRSSAAPES